MTDERFAELRKQNSSVALPRPLYVRLLLDEIKRLRRQLDEATTDRDAWESKARSLAAESCRVHYANPDYLNAKGDE